jgi:hypothetical protein
VVGWDWGPGRPNLGGFLGGSGYPSGPGACVTMLIGHTHKRGTLFTADLVDQNGTRTELYRQTDYADPKARLFNDAPLLVVAGQKIAYQCTHDNATHPRLGCEETPGVTPGGSVFDAISKNGLRNISGAAKLCTAEGPDAAECPPTDDKHPGRTFTGNCVQAKLVFGFTSEDDMCIMPGYYYDADMTAPPGEECKL